MTLTEDQLEVLRAIVEHVGDEFTELVQVAGLRREVDFRHTDMQKVDFGSASLSGFDFTGANLRGANFSKAKTLNAVFDGADLTGSLLSSLLNSKNQLQSGRGVRTIVKLARGVRITLWLERGSAEASEANYFQNDLKLCMMVDSIRAMPNDYMIELVVTRGSHLIRFEGGDNHHKLELLHISDGNSQTIRLPMCVISDKRGDAKIEVVNVEIKDGLGTIKLETASVSLNLPIN